MTAKINNPFVTSGYISNEYFCDRQSETLELIGAFLNERNTVLVSPRRMGKTGLIEHCFQQNAINGEYYTFFIDIYATGSLRELVFILGKEIFETLKPKGKKFTEQFFSIISSLRPAYKLDSINGEPIFDISLGEIKQPALSLEEIFNYLEKAEKRCIIAIDEFQQIAKYPEKNVEAILRTHIQKCKNTTFVFSGSQRHMMQNIFFSASRPFYQSASLLSLEAIAIEEYREFIHYHFNKANKSITDNCITSAYNLLEGHTWYMQDLFNRLYEQTDIGEVMDTPFANIILHSIIDAYKTIAQNTLMTLPLRQKEVLIAIGREGKAYEITSIDFAHRHALSSSSSIQSAVKQLLEKEIITKNENSYQVYDRFIGLWIAKNYGMGFTL